MRARFRAGGGGGSDDDSGGSSSPSWRSRRSRRRNRIRRGGSGGSSGSSGGGTSPGRTRGGGSGSSGGSGGSSGGSDGGSSGRSGGSSDDDSGGSSGGRTSPGRTRGSGSGGSGGSEDPDDANDDSDEGSSSRYGGGAGQQRDRIVDDDTSGGSGGSDDTTGSAGSGPSGDMPRPRPGGPGSEPGTPPADDGADDDPAPQPDDGGGDGSTGRGDIGVDVDDTPGADDIHDHIRAGYPTDEEVPSGEELDPLKRRHMDRVVGIDRTDWQGDVFERVNTEDALSGQGVEADGSDDRVTLTFGDEEFTGTMSEAASEFESRFLESNPEYSAEDVAVVNDDGSFGIELTRTGAESVNREIADQEEDLRQELEERLEERTGMDVNPWDYTIVEQDGDYRADPTSDFEERVRKQRNREVRDRLEADLEEQTGMDVGHGDFDVVHDGEGYRAEPTDSFRDEMRREAAEKAEEQLENQIGGQRADDRGIVNVDLRQRVAEEVDLERGEDFTISFGDDGSASASLTDSYVRRQAEDSMESQLASQGRDVDLDPDTDLEIGDDGSVTLSEAGRETVQNAEQEERFGDFAVHVGSTSGTPGMPAPSRNTADMVEQAGSAPDVDYESRRLEDVLGDAADSYTSTVHDLTQEGEEMGENDVVLGSAIAMGLEAAGYDETAEDVEQFQREVIRGGAETLNAPAVAAGLKEGVEFVGHGISETAQGRGGVDVSLESGADSDLSEGRVQVGMNTIDVDATEDGFTGRAGRAGGEAVTGFKEQAEENPVRTGAYLGGSLLASSAVMAGAARVSPRAGAASRAVIQPGEELVGYAGHVTTKATAGQKAADRAFPDKEPVFMSEEFALRQVDRAWQGTRSRIETGASVVRGETGLAELASTMNVERAERFRPGGPTSVAGEETTQVAPPSEPLGSGAPDPGVVTDLGGTRARFDRARAETAELDRERAEDAAERISDEVERARRPPEPGLDRIARQAQEAETWNRMSDELGVDVEAMTGGGMDIRPLRRGRGHMDEALDRIGEAQRIEADLESRYGPGYDSDLYGRGEAESELERASEARRHLGYKTEAETEARSEARARRAELAEMPSVGFGARGAQIEAGAELAGYSSRAEPRASGAAAETEMESELQAEARADTELRLGFETETRARAEAEAEFRLGYEGEIETGPGFERKTKKQGRRRAEGAPSGKSTGDEDPLAVGYLAETFAGFAGLGVAGGEGFGVSQSDLEEQAEGGGQPFGEYTPSWGASEAEAFDDTLDWFGVGGDGEGGWL